MSYIFVSYSRKDEKYVKRLINHTQKLGFDVWFDQEDIEIGDSWWSKIDRAIRNSTVFVVVMSPNAEASRYVGKEIHLADGYEKPIFPLLIAGEVFSFLRDSQYCDLRPPAGVDKPPLPNRDFYRTLEKYASRHPRLTPGEMAITKQKRSIETQKRQELVASKETFQSILDPDPAKIDEIIRWSAFEQDGVTNYYGIAMLALAYEASGTYKGHLKALDLLRRACMIEPNVKNKHFMTKEHAWGEDQHQLIEKLLKDPKFGKFK